MSFYAAYLRTLFRRPGLAITALYWHLTGRRLRARNRLRMAAPQARNAYRNWIDSVEQQDKLLAAARHDIIHWDNRPRISVILYDQPSPGGWLAAGQMERMLNSLAAQCYPDWELVMVQSYDSAPPRAAHVPRITLAPSRANNYAQALALGVQSASGDFILPLPAQTCLPPTALYDYARAISDNPDAEIIYGDHDEISSRGRRSRPWFKPEWNPELFLAQDYISQACVIRTEVARRDLPVHPALGEAAAYALLQSICARPGSRPLHFPHILAHAASGQSGSDHATRAAVVARRLGGSGAIARLGPYGTVEVNWPLPENPPLVSILIPTRDGVNLLKTCVLGVLDGTRYRNFEIIIIDNGSRDPETLNYLGRIAQNPRVRVIRDNRPFNFSALNNLAAREARGEYLCLLNNDIEIIDENWLTALMRQAMRPHIGAAGAKLLYPDGTIQHAGVTIGIGQAAGHAHRFQPNATQGYFARAHAAHYVSAVTAACLVVSKAKYWEVGGLDEAAFAVAFNDVDFCLKLRKADYQNVYVPHAVLIHHESKSRGRDTNPEHIDRYRRELACLQERWQTVDYADPLHHPALDRSSEKYVIGFGV